MTDRTIVKIGVSRDPFVASSVTVRDQNIEGVYPRVMLTVESGVADASIILNTAQLVELSQSLVDYLKDFGL